MPSEPLIGVLMHENTAYAAAVKAGIGRYALSHGGWRFIFAVFGAQPLEAQIAAFRGDALIASVSDSVHAEAALSLGIPVVSVVSRHLHPRIPVVHRDIQQTGQLAATHLLQQGYPTLAYFGNANPVMCYISEYERVGMEQVTARPVASFLTGPRTGPGNTWSLENQLADLADWLLTLPQPTGIMATDDVHGQRLIEAAKRAGLQVPHDIGVVGGGNDPAIWPLCDPPLSSIVTPEAQIGETAARVLADMLAGRTDVPRRTAIPCQTLIARNSSSALRISDQTVHEAMQRVREHLDQPLTVDELAQMVHVSRRTLHRRFLAALGRSPAQAIRQARIERASRLLAETDRSMTDIALDVGFSHPSQLSRAMREQTGKSPSAFRRQIRRSRN